MNIPDVSVVLTAFGRPQHLLSCLRSLSLQTVQAEIIVCEDGEDERIKAVIESFGAKHIARADRPSRPANNIGPLMNMAARAASGEILILFNQDHEAISAEWIRWMSVPIIVDPMAVVAAPCSLRGKYGEHVLWKNGSNHKRNYGEPGAELGLPVYFFVGTSLRRDLFSSVGGFDEDFTGWGYEDWDIGERLAAAGAHYQTAPEHMMIVHNWHEKNEWGAESNRELYRKKLELYRKKLALVR